MPETPQAPLQPTLRHLLDAKRPEQLLILINAVAYAIAKEPDWAKACTHIHQEEWDIQLSDLALIAEDPGEWETMLFAIRSPHDLLDAFDMLLELYEGCTMAVVHHEMVSCGRPEDA